MPTREVDVLVIGAGMSGLACAQRLAEQSADFFVLEAADRVGGRVSSNYAIAHGPPVETGALMIHGKHVITHTWAADLGVAVRRLPMVERTVLLRDRRPARFPWMALPFHPVFGVRAAYQFRFGVPRQMRELRDPDRSLAEFLDRSGTVPGARSLSIFLHAHINSADPEEIGARSTGREEALSEEGWRDHFQLLDGYSELARRRAAPFGDRVRLSTRVTEIRWSGEGVRIEARQGGEETEFRARAAVITLPLGVLKDGTVAFDPALPDEKLRAIRRIGYGAVMETILRLEGGNLVERLGPFAMLWGNTATSFDRPFVGLSSRPEVISAFTAGREAVRRARLDDAAVVEAAVAELESILPSGCRVGTVVDSAIQRWPANPWIRGGYSFLPPGVGTEERHILAAPVEGRLFFAGEATHYEGEPATVHGAIETGYRAAREVLRALTPDSTAPAGGLQ